MKFYTGDIVEILNLSASQIESIRSQRCNFNLQPQKEIVGMRYMVLVWKSYDSTMRYSMIGWNHGGHCADIFDSTQLVLHKRLLKNWWKLFVEKMKTRNEVQK